LLIKRKIIFAVFAASILVLFLNALDKPEKNITDGIQTENISGNAIYLQWFSKIIDRNEKYFNSFVSNINRAYIYHIISHFHQNFHKNLA
jgi:hypothetical protein